MIEMMNINAMRRSKWPNIMRCCNTLPYKKHQIYPYLIKALSNMTYDQADFRLNNPSYKDEASNSDEERLICTSSY